RAAAGLPHRLARGAPGRVVAAQHREDPHGDSLRVAAAGHRRVRRLMTTSCRAGPVRTDRADRSVRTGRRGWATSRATPPPRAGPGRLLVVGSDDHDAEALP